MDKTMKFSIFAVVLTVILIGAFSAVSAQEAPDLPPPPDIEGFDFEKDPERFKEVASGGVPMGRWKEGLLFDGIEPMP